MSLASISSIENASSLFFENKQHKHLESSENFQNFLANSAYTNRPKAPDHPKPKLQAKRSDSIKVLEEVIEHLDPKKRPVTPREAKPGPKPSTPFVESLFSDYADLPGPSKPYYKMSLGDMSNNITGITGESPTKIRQRPQEMYSRGFDIPKGVSMDKETRQYIEGLHSRIMGMEKEMVRLKKENYDLKVQNKFFKEKMAAVINDQEIIAKDIEVHEKKIVSLRENCQNNNDMVNSLKRILTLQEDELLERMSKKEDESDKAKSALLFSSPRKTRSSIRINKNFLRSATSSIDPIKEKLNENDESKKEKKVVVRVNTTRTPSISSVEITRPSTARLKRAISMKESPLGGKGI